MSPGMIRAMSHGSIKVRLTLAFAAVAVLGILVTAVVVARGVTHRFDVYVGRYQQMRAEAIAARLVEAYEEGGGSIALLVGEADRLARLTGLSARLVDAQGQVIWQSPGPLHGPRGPRWRRNLGPAPGEKALPLVSDGRVVATLYFWVPTGPAAREEEVFLAGVRRSLWWAGIIAAAVAGLLGLGVAQGLSRPLTHLKEAADRIRLGELDTRVAEEGSGEVRALARAFNHLARSLARQDELRRNLTADVAHELRTPLAVLRGHIEAMQDGIWEASPENLAAVHGEIMRLVRLVGDLERLNEAESGVLDLAWTDVDLGEITRRVLTAFRPSFEQKGVALSERVEGSWPLRGDEDKLSQVVWNLVSNAFKFTPGGGRVEVEISARKPGPGVQLAIRDTGPGIAPEDAPHVFDRFFRRAGQEGTGIGLAIAQALARAHGGHIEVRSQVGEGSTFTLFLPGNPPSTAG